MAKTDPGWPCTRMAPERPGRESCCAGAADAEKHPAKAVPQPWRPGLRSVDPGDLRCAMPGSNQRHPVCKTGALPLS
jgi:hypothetical protein